MGKLITIILALFLTAPAFAGSANVLPSLSIGGRIITNTENLIAVTCTSVTAGQWWGVFKGSAIYQVPAGKQFRIVGIKAVESAGADRCKVGYATNPVPVNTGTDPGTQHVFGQSWAANPDLNNNQSGFFPTGVNGVEYYLGDNEWIVPVNSPGWHMFCSCNEATQTSTVVIYGFEETP